VKATWSLSEENNQTNLLKAAAIGVQLGMSAEEIAGELENVADNFWQMRGERN
jgi:UDP-N-acetylmuramyl pentapeptide synthase